MDEERERERLTRFSRVVVGQFVAAQTGDRLQFFVSLSLSLSLCRSPSDSEYLTANMRAWTTDSEWTDRADGWRETDGQTHSNSTMYGIPAAILVTGLGSTQTTLLNNHKFFHLFILGYLPSFLIEIYQQHLVGHPLP